MKALIKSTTIIIALTALFSLNLNASGFSFAEESYIDDIPFNTTKIYNELMAVNDLAIFDFAEEEYIDDIPFNIDVNISNKLSQDAYSVDFEFEEEEYINDIRL